MSRRARASSMPMHSMIDDNDSVRSGRCFNMHRHVRKLLQATPTWTSAGIPNSLVVDNHIHVLSQQLATGRTTTLLPHHLQQGAFSPALRKAVRLVCIASWLQGYILVILNFPLQELQNSLLDFDLAKEAHLDRHNHPSSAFVLSSVFTWACLLASFFVAAAIASGICLPLANCAGRRFVICAIGIGYTLGGFIPSFDNSITFVASRTCNGFAAGLASIAIPLYLGEVAPPNSRSKVGLYHNSMICLGMLCAAIMGRPIGASSLSDTLGFIVGGLGIAIALSSYLVLYPSPRWLMMQNRRGDASEVLLELRNHRDITFDMSCLEIGLHGKTEAQVKKDIESAIKIERGLEKIYGKQPELINTSPLSEDVITMMQPSTNTPREFSSRVRVSHVAKLSTTPSSYSSSSNSSTYVSPSTSYTYDATAEGATDNHHLRDSEPTPPSFHDSTDSAPERSSSSSSSSSMQHISPNDRSNSSKSRRTEDRKQNYADRLSLQVSSSSKSIYTSRKMVLVYVLLFTQQLAGLFTILFSMEIMDTFFNTVPARNTIYHMQHRERSHHSSLSSSTSSSTSPSSSSSGHGLFYDHVKQQDFYVECMEWVCIVLWTTFAYILTCRVLNNLLHGRFDKQKYLQRSLSGCGICFLLLSILAYIADKQAPHSGTIYLCCYAAIFLFVGFIGFFTLGLGPLPWILCAEQFPVTEMVRGMGVATTIYWISGAIATFAMPFEMQYLTYLALTPSVIVIAIAYALVTQWLKHSSETLPLSSQRGSSSPHSGSDLPGSRTNYGSMETSDETASNSRNAVFQTPNSADEWNMSSPGSFGASSNDSGGSHSMYISASAKANKYWHNAPVNRRYSPLGASISDDEGGEEWKQHLVKTGSPDGGRDRSQSCSSMEESHHPSPASLRGMIRSSNSDLSPILRAL